MAITDSIKKNPAGQAYWNGQWYASVDLAAKASLAAGGNGGVSSTLLQTTPPVGVTVIGATSTPTTAPPTTTTPTTPTPTTTTPTTTTTTPTTTTTASVPANIYMQWTYDGGAGQTQWWFNGKSYTGYNDAVAAAKAAGFSTVARVGDSASNINGSVKPAGATVMQTPQPALNATQLMKKALESGNLNNLQNNTWWSAQPETVKTAAYNTLTSAMQSPQALANLLTTTGVTNYQNSAWWTSLPLTTRQQAYSLATQSGTNQSGNTGNTAGTTNGSNTGTTGTTTGTPAPTAGTTTNTTSDNPINTGNAQFDTIANQLYNTFYSLLQQTAGNSIIQPLTDADMAALKQQVETKYGPQITAYQQQADKAYNQGISNTQGQTAINKEQLDLSNARASEDYNRLSNANTTDKNRQIQVLGRNYQQATLDAQASLQGAGRTISGERVYQENKLATNQAQDVTSVTNLADTEAQRLAAEQQRVNEDNALTSRSLDLSQQNSEFGLQQAKDQSTTNLQNYRQQAYDALVAQQQNLPNQFSSLLLNQPDWASVSTPSTVTTAAPISTGTVDYSSVPGLSTTKTITPTYTYPTVNSNVTTSATGFVNNPAIIAARKAKGYSTAKTF